MYYINFENDVFIDENIDLSHLKDLVRIYLNRCDSYQITILKEDKKSKKILDDFAVYSDENGYEYILQGIVDEDFKEMILKNLIGDMALNFMGLSLYDDGILKLEILNYGSEVYIYGFDEKTVVEFSDELEKVYGIKEVNVYIDEDSQEESHHHDHNDHDHSCGCHSDEDDDKSCGCGGSCNN
ncbi:MAG: hypothetical protein QP753_05810 [Peptoniphilus harei]|uniref:Uncharacterized protein n=1 Tax=Peptoniphilus harei ACS-146-V-Sch2b TaxID=908338 RepID=E4KXW3_9FIRM|nr:hypothetical protein [Peptoniphilus harei]EFR33357.1 conserved hypothetical protein [Peptoniphilus harei ACS-146-V-Sch2b]MDK7755363.1 hypothetical protein [Peptoniphilus harei]MDK7761598.1 hypothetical protein [Peptoniphilus harei]MDK8271123.1 hypothetical protein [Peptoniphilus harei]MDK8339289.1 hypothetical protein [Peptoniphilus harei]